MPFKLTLTAILRQAGWKVTIHDAEGAEEPHATIYKKGRRWRISLRTGEFLEDKDKWSQLDKKLRKLIEGQWLALQEAWDAIHGEYNPISSEDENDDTDAEEEASD